MGKGDKKTRRGKLFQGSYGVRRRRRKGKIKVSPKVVAAQSKPVEVNKPVKVAEVKNVKKEVKEPPVAKPSRASSSAKKTSKTKKQAKSAS
jgi:30S ribosomal protein S31